MSLFNLINGTLEIIKEKDFELEKDIQKLTENNLNTIFGLEFVKSEFSINNFRIDTLAYDIEASSFVIIEYKKDKNYSVIDQGYAYLALLLNNKADFILEYNENLNKALKKDAIDWSQSKVIFISPLFTTYQKQSINFKDLPIELWEIRKYNNSSISYTKLQTSGASESIKTISNANKKNDIVVNEIQTYTESDHLSKGDEEILELYEKYKNAILNLGDVDVQPKKKYIAFINSTNFVDIQIQRKSLKFHINLKINELNDNLNIARDVSKIGHYGNGDYEIQTDNDDNFDYVLSLIKQSYKKNKN